ncbi:MAG: hypothetical protein M3Z09_09755 [Acidobacteriota bacterium]|nr:hypothetical protein [Acidobacteriota bacterium]
MGKTVDSGNFEARQAERNAELDNLLGRYREACGTPEAGPNFMPALWKRIDSRRSRTARFESAARALAACALALSLVLGAFLAYPSQQNSAFYSGSFVDAIDTAADNETIFEPVHFYVNERGRE